MSKTMEMTVLPPSYFNLVRKFPPVPIESEEAYDAAVRVIEPLVVRGEDDLDKGELAYLNALDMFISAYDQEHFRFEDRRTPLERLKYVLKESNTSPTALREILGCSQPLVSMILNGDRELSKGNIRALAEHFKVEAGLFL